MPGSFGGYNRRHPSGNRRRGGIGWRFARSREPPHPHNPVSPLGLAACLQLAAAIPNFAIQEYPIGTPHIDGRKGLVGEDFLIGTPVAENGFITISDKPGIGIELTPDAAQKFPPRRRSIQHIHARLHDDGSVLDH